MDESGLTGYARRWWNKTGLGIARPSTTWSSITPPEKSLSTRFLFFIFSLLYITVRSCRLASVVVRVKLQEIEFEWSESLVTKTRFTFNFDLTHSKDRYDDNKEKEKKNLLKLVVQDKEISRVADKRNPNFDSGRIFHLKSVLLEVKG